MKDAISLIVLFMSIALVIRLQEAGDGTSIILLFSISGAVIFLTLIEIKEQAQEIYFKKTMEFLEDLKEQIH